MTGRSARNNSPLLEVTGAPVLVKESDLEMLTRRMLERRARRLVMVCLPPAGPPVMLGLGHLLPGGQASLNRLSSMSSMSSLEMSGLEDLVVTMENVARHLANR